MIQNLKSRKGEAAYIYLCSIILFAAMLFSVLFLYMGLVGQIQIQKRDMQSRLENYLTGYARDAFNALKQGDQYESYLDYEALKQGCFSALGLGETDAEYTYENGNCTVTNPEITVLTGDGFGLTVEYIASFPIRWNGKTFLDLTVPVRLTSFYQTKQR